ncbi:complex III assembly factor LYRM7-like isoform X2 [Tubulanus polymorphus]|uniref:complex III assembly factor LYRM7-like isoform X2 n=1 Tax=Tubulanus polymorphus TaxID=672921 RepID=UPI003DA1F008
MARLSISDDLCVRRSCYLMNPFKTEVLSIFKRLHRTRLLTFRGDEQALIAGRKKINDEFKKFKETKELETIKYLLKSAEEAEEYLRTSVIQATQSNPGVFSAEITENTKLLDNTPYKYSPEETMRRTEKQIQRRRTNNRDCGCQEKQ